MEKVTLLAEALKKDDTTSTEDLVGKTFCTLLISGYVFRGMLFWVPWHSAIFINSLLLSPETFAMFFM